GPRGGGSGGQRGANRARVVRAHADHSSVVDPILRDRGIRSLLGVPLMAGGEVIGVLHVGSLTSRHFSEDEIELLELAAERVAFATQARQVRVTRSATATLQRSLLPAELPSVPDLDFASRYAPGGGGDVGGDWYDVFDVPSGHVFVVVGDVAGSGMAAAVAMGRLRTALRSYALQTVDPAEVLARLDGHVRHFERGIMATVLCAVLAPSHGSLLVSSAGHPPPLTAA